MCLLYAVRPISRVMSLSDHLSRPSVARRLQRPTWKHDGQPYCFRFGLASNGVYMCPFCYHNGGSLLHCLSTLTFHKEGGLFLLHWSGSHLHRTLSGILPFEARTFLTWPLSVLSAATIYSTYRISLPQEKLFVNYIFYCIICIVWYNTKYKEVFSWS